MHMVNPLPFQIKAMFFFLLLLYLLPRSLYFTLAVSSTSDLHILE